MFKKTYVPGETVSPSIIIDTTAMWQMSKAELESQREWLLQQIREESVESRKAILREISLATFVVMKKRNFLKEGHF